MKLLAIFAIFLLVVSLTSSQPLGNPIYTGQPGCKTEGELTVGVYPHFRNKRAYWKCSTLGVPATLQFCPISQGFLQPARSCVSWAEWYWTPTVAPPSSPN